MNNDLISRSALRNDFDEKCYGECCYCTERDDESGECGLIRYAPAVDAVEVVRCRDCLNCGMKASIKYDGYRDDVRLCMLHGIAVLPNDYCSGGVKADAEVEG